MKTWVMVRHATSSWAFNLPDRESPLAARGIRDANLIGAHLHNMDIHVDKTYSSPAKRAFDTALIVTSALKKDTTNIETVEDLYDFSGHRALDFVRGLPNHLSTVMTFGHNNACSYLAKTLGGFVGDNIPTAAVVIFRFDVSLWSEIYRCKCSTITPKELR